MTMRSKTVAAGLASLVLAAACVSVTADGASRRTSTDVPRPSEEEARLIAREAYVYLYPLVTMDVTRKVALHSDPAVAGIGAPANTFNHIRAFPTAEMRQVVRPNFDTLYSSAWLDLRAGPVLVSHADTGERFFLLPMLDMWTDVFAAPGTRTSGNRAATFALCPPGWRGELPAHAQRIDAPTPYVWIIGRTQTNGPSDYAAVHAVQNGFTITSVSGAAFQATPRDPNVDTATEPLVQVNSMSAPAFFAYATELLALHPPHATDWSILQRLARIGIVRGQPFDPSRTTPEILEEAKRASLATMKELRPTASPVVNGWRMKRDGGVFGSAYLQRAMTAMGGLGANVPEDAMYPTTIVDGDGQPLKGEQRYVLHFERDELPPAGAFWSVTLYDMDGFQIPNALDRFAIGDRDPLRFHADGSLDLFIQHASPGAEHESNWLPTPASGPINLTIRLYAPEPEVLDGRWNPPPIRRVTE